LVTVEVGGEEIIAEDKSGAGAEAGLGTTEDDETKDTLFSKGLFLSLKATGILLMTVGTIFYLVSFCEFVGGGLESYCVRTHAYPWASILVVAGALAVVLAVTFTALLPRRYKRDDS
jgi:hypothetical protein